LLRTTNPGSRLQNNGNDSGELESETKQKGDKKKMTEQAMIGLQLSTLLWIGAFALGGFGILLEMRLLKAQQQGVAGRGYIRALFADATDLLTFGNQKPVGKDEYDRLADDAEAMRSGVQELPSNMRAVRANTDTTVETGKKIEGRVKAVEEKMVGLESTGQTMMVAQERILNVVEKLEGIIGGGRRR